MTLAGLAWRYLWARPLVAALNLLMLALGFGAMVFVTLVGEQLERQTQRDLAGIDLVVGAKGSPLQMILAGVFQVDVPTGNIPLATVAQLRDAPAGGEVRAAVDGRRAAGFSHRRHRRRSTSICTVRGSRQGRLWARTAARPCSAPVSPATTGLGLGQTFAGTHGLGNVTATCTRNAPYTVVGTLAPLRLRARSAGADRHRVGLGRAREPERRGRRRQDREALDAEREVTMLLVRYRTPTGRRDAAALGQRTGRAAGGGAGPREPRACSAPSAPGSTCCAASASCCCWWPALSVFVALTARRARARARPRDAAHARRPAAARGRVAGLRGALARRAWACSPAWRRPWIDTFARLGTGGRPFAAVDGVVVVGAAPGACWRAPCCWRCWRWPGR